MQSVSQREGNSEHNKETTCKWFPRGKEVESKIKKAMLLMRVKEKESKIMEKD